MNMPPASISPPSQQPDRPPTDRCEIPSNELVDRLPQNQLLTTIQPGGGVVMSIELAWGKLRRQFLRFVRPGYVANMRSTRRGTAGSIPFEPVDPRDVKYYANQDTYHWDAADDPFTWRDRLPFVRAGLAELVLMGGGCVILALIFGMTIYWPLSIVLLVVAGWVAWFFRNPHRQISTVAGDVVSPADGKLVQIESIDDPVLGPCLQFGIFLSIFNVHANRTSIAGKVVAIDYRPGAMLNALKQESVRENENLDLILQPLESTDRRYRIRQITGQFARRIVCWAKVGDTLARGEMYGMIKLGSRTELIVPHDHGFVAVAKIGDKVMAGTTILGRYEQPVAAENMVHEGRGPQR